MDRPLASLRRLSALVAALLCAPAIALESGNSLPERWQAVPDGELATMRGGIDFGPLVASFAVERLIRINGEVVARTHLALSGFGDLANGLVPSVEVLGNLANLIQVGGGAGGGGGGGGEPLTASDMAQFAQAIGQGAQGGSSSTSMAASSSNGRTGAGGADAVAGGSIGGLSSAQAPGGPGSSVPAASVPAAIAAAQGAGGRPVSVGGVAPRPPQTGLFGQHASTLPGRGSTPSGSGTVSPAMPGASPASQVASGTIMNPPISVPIGNTGQAIVVSGIPNAAALATSIQNSVEATRIETLTSINATLSSLAALRSSNFAETMRQQAIDSIRR